MEHLVDACANFFVGDKLFLVELAEPLLDLLAEPRVMVKLMLYELPDIFFHATVIFCCDAGQLCLEFGTKVHFEASLGVEVAGVKCPQTDLARRASVRLGQGLNDLTQRLGPPKNSSLL